MGEYPQPPQKKGLVRAWGFIGIRVKGLGFRVKCKGFRGFSKILQGPQRLKATYSAPKMTCSMCRWSSLLVNQSYATLKKPDNQQSKVIGEYIWDVGFGWFRVWDSVFGVLSRPVEFSFLQTYMHK